MGVLGWRKTVSFPIGRRRGDFIYFSGLKRRSTTICRDRLATLMAQINQTRRIMTHAYGCVRPSYPWWRGLNLPSSSWVLLGPMQNNQSCDLAYPSSREKDQIKQPKASRPSPLNATFKDLSTLSLSIFAA